MAARKRWRRYIPDDEISVRAFLHLIGRLFYMSAFIRNIFC